MAQIIPFPGTQVPAMVRDRVHIKRVVAAAALAELATLGGMRAVASVWARYLPHVVGKVPPALTPERLSAALAPTFGAAAAYLAGYYVGRSVQDRHELHGLLVGACCAVFTCAALITAPVPYRMLYLAACGVQLLGGFAGGSAGRRHRAEPSSPASGHEDRLTRHAGEPPAS